MTRRNKLEPPPNIAFSDWKQAIDSVSQSTDEPGAKTAIEIAKGLNRSSRQTHHWLKKLVEQGKARRCRITRPDANGSPRWTSGYVLIGKIAPPPPASKGDKAKGIAASKAKKAR